MAAIEPIKIQGLVEFSRDLRRLDKDLPKVLRQSQNKGAQLVVDWAQPRIKSISGKTRRSVRATSTRTEAKVTGGGARVPWYPWIDFGGRVGRKRSVHRPFDANGRYIYPGFWAQREEVLATLTQSLIEVAGMAGIGVQDG